ncbi:MAG: hypothetical protein JW801_08695 [Bacteroidales bacterium]|nr:hypothetical protein [Bacteroidales bacterium]
MPYRILVWFLLLPAFTYGQQNHTLYQMQYVPQSNFLNPAIQSPCTWFIGIPVLSSLHVNYANSAFSFNNLITITNPSTAELRIDRVVERMGRRTLIGAEVQTSILALGYQQGGHYFNFSINEKVNLPVTFSKEAFQLPWEGNTQFVNEHAGTRGTSTYANHYREYALGYSKQGDFDGFWGVKGKLLFGKAYLGVPESDVSLFTDSAIYTLTLEGNVRANMSAPIIPNLNNGRSNTMTFEPVPDLSIYRYLMNSSNWGLAVDAGFIYELDGRTQISGSILDLGFIRWRSDVSNIFYDGQFTYEGILADSINIIGSIMDTIHLEITHENFITMLPLKAYLAGQYGLSNRLTAGVMTATTVYRTKFMPSLTLSLDYSPLRNFHLIASYSLMYRSFNNLGLGLSVGRGPVQFYAVTDNLTGLIWPLTARNLNLRFGLNINLGCSEKKERPEHYSSPGAVTCPAYMDELQRQKKRR